MYRQRSNIVTETLITVPETHPNHNKYSNKASVLQWKAAEFYIMNCKRNEYNIKYRSLDLQETIGDKIRCSRLHAGFTIKELSHIVNIDYTTLLRYEHNNISEDQINTQILLLIEKACGIEKYSLFNNYLLFYETGELKKLRKQHSISQKQLAKHLGNSYKTVSRWESQKIRPPRKTWESTMDYFNELKRLSNSSTT